MTDHHGSSGWFNGSNWWINAHADDRRSVEYASAHESHHRQLTNSTTFGGLTRLLAELPGASTRAAAQDLTRAAWRIHESFASWAPALALGWTRDELVSKYPSYASCYDAMQAFVDPLDHPYLQMHVAHAVARVCMQAPVVDIALARGLGQVTLADLRATLHPDRRFQRLRRHPPNWSHLIEKLDASRSRPEWSEIFGSERLTAGLFRPEFQGFWELVNNAAFELLAETLRESGFPTLGPDDQLAALNQLSVAAIALGGRYDLSGNGSEPMAAVVLRNIESEGFTAGPPLRLTQHPPSTDLSAMQADLEAPHLFLTLRRPSNLMTNYLTTESDDGEPRAYLRRTIADADGQLTVELLDVTDRLPDSPARLPLPTVTCVPMSLLTSTLATRLRALLDPQISTILIDRPLGDHFNIWLAHPDAVFRHVLLRTEAHGRVVPVLVGLLEGDAAKSHLMVKPLSPAAVGIHKAAFLELDPSQQRIVVDPSILQLHPKLLQLSLAHLVGEEVRFPPVW